MCSKQDEKSRYETIIRNGGSISYGGSNGISPISALASTAGANRFDKRILTALVRSHLMHYAYEDTLKLFDAYTPKLPAPRASADLAMNDSDMSDVKGPHASNGRSHANGNSTANAHSNLSSNGSSNGTGSTAPAASADPAFASVSARKRIRESICSGDIRLAISLIDALIPAAPSAAPAIASAFPKTAVASAVSGMKRLELSRRGVAFQIQCMRFLQIIQQKQTDDAIKFARDVLTAYNNESVYQSTLHVRSIRM